MLSTTRSVHRINVPGFYMMHVPAALFMVAAGVILYGWPAAATILIVLAGAGCPGGLAADRMARTAA